MQPGRFISAIARAGNRLVVADEMNDRILQFDLFGTNLSPTVIPQSRVAYAAISRDGRFLAASTWKANGVNVWSPQGLAVTNLPVQDGGNPFFSPDGEWLVIGGSSYLTWRTRDWSRGPALSIPEPNIIGGAVDFSSDSRLIVLLVGNHAIQLHRFPGGELLATFETPERWRLAQPRFSPDGTRLLALAPEHGFVSWDLPKLRQELKSMKLDWE